MKSSDLTKEEIVTFLNRQVLNGLGVPIQKREDIILKSLEMIQESNVDFKKIFLSPYTLEAYNDTVRK